MDDAKDYITIDIRLTKGNYNRMWEIKVSVQFTTYLHYNSLSSLIVIYRRSDIVHNYYQQLLS